MTGVLPLRNAHVLLVEDDAGDVLLTTEAFARYPVQHTLHVASDGEQAIQFVHRTGDFANVPRPWLILLDLNLPHRTGLEVLAEVKSDQDLRSIPVVMLSSSPTEEDIFRSYSLHANAYVTKPVNFECFSDVVGQIIDFFLTLVEQPNCAHDHYQSETDQAVADKRPGRLAHRRAAG